MLVTRRIKGFTLVEVLLTVAVASALVAVSIPIASTAIPRNELDTTVTTLTQVLRRAEALSRAGENDSGWGVYVSSSDIVLFQGDDYETRDVAYDVVYDLPRSVSVSAMVEVNYSKMSGYPVSAGTITLNSTTGDSISIHINERGTASN